MDDFDQFLDSQLKDHTEKKKRKHSEKKASLIHDLHFPNGNIDNIITQDKKDKKEKKHIKAKKEKKRHKHEKNKEEEEYQWVEASSTTTQDTAASEEKELPQKLE